MRLRQKAASDDRAGGVWGFFAAGPAVDSLDPPGIYLMTRNASTSTRGCPAVPSTFSSSECAPVAIVLVYR